MALSVRAKPLLLVAVGLLLAGCGAGDAAISVPDAIAQNANFSLNGPLLDDTGKSLPGVLMDKEWHHHFWTPVAGGTDTNEGQVQVVNNRYSIDERGTELEAHFTKDGYYPVKYTIRASDPDYVVTPVGDWKNVKDLPVVMFPVGKRDDTLVQYDHVVDYSSYPDAEVISILPGRQIVEKRDARNAALRPNTLYLTLTPGTLVPKNSSGDLDPVEVNLPGSVTLHVSDPKGGFIRIAPKPGFEPIRCSSMAPTTGYSAELAIDHSRLLEMRRSSLSRIIEAHEYFYFKSGNHYGKGEIEWSEQALKDDKSVHKLAFRFRLWVQADEEDPNMATWLYGGWRDG